MASAKIETEQNNLYFTRKDMGPLQKRTTTIRHKKKQKKQQTEKKGLTILKTNNFKAMKTVG